MLSQCMHGKIHALPGIHVKTAELSLRPSVADTCWIVVGTELDRPVHRCPPERLGADAPGDRAPPVCMLPDSIVRSCQPRRRVAMLAQRQPQGFPAPRPFGSRAIQFAQSVHTLSTNAFQIG